MTDRVVVRAPATLRHRFSAAGATAVTVDATTADGTAILTGAAADAPGTGEDHWTVPVPAADLTDPTLLTVDWDAGAGWVETDLVEVAGGRYLLPDDLRDGSGAGEGLNRDRFTDDLLEAAIVVAERRIEIATSVAWVPRWASETVSLVGRARAWLRPNVRTLQSVTIVGPTSTSVDDPDLWVVSPLGLATRRAEISQHLVQLEVAYLHGRDAPPTDLRDAAREAAAEMAKGKMNSRVPATADSMSTGGYTFNFAHQADLKRGRPFGMPDVDAVVMSHAAEIPAVA